MKKIFSILLLGIVFSPVLSASAVVETEFMTSETFLRNQGYSPETARIVNYKKTDPYTPQTRKYNGFGGFFKRIGHFLADCYYYIDPSSDNGNFANEMIVSPGLDSPSNL